MIIHNPKTEESRRELAKQKAYVHADIVLYSLRKLEGPYEQKAALLDAIIAETKEKARLKT